MIKDFETYIAEGRMGRLIDAARNDEVRQEDISSRFFGPDKEWMLYEPNGNRVFYQDKIDDALEEYGKKGWRLVTINDFYHAFGYDEEGEPDEISHRGNIRYSFNNMYSKFTRIPLKDGISTIRGKYGEMSIPAVGHISGNSMNNQVTCIGMESHFFVLNFEGNVCSGYINQGGFCCIYVSGNIDKAASILLIRDKK